MGDHEKESKPGLLSNATYDFLKWLAQIVLPAAGALYFGLAEIWGLPKASEVVGTIVVVDTFLGVLLGLSTAKYNASDEAYDGHLYVRPGEDEESTAVGLQVTSSGQELLQDDKKQARFKVHHNRNP